MNTDIEAPMRDRPALPTEVEEKIREMYAAQAAEADALTSARNATSNKEAAVDALASAFLSFYLALPLAVRNKVRHEINTTKETKGYER